MPILTTRVLRSRRNTGRRPTGQSVSNGILPIEAVSQARGSSVCPCSAACSSAATKSARTRRGSTLSSSRERSGSGCASRMTRSGSMPRSIVITEMGSMDTRIEFVEEVWIRDQAHVVYVCRSLIRIEEPDSLGGLDREAAEELQKFLSLGSHREPGVSEAFADEFLAVPVAV